MDITITLPKEVENALLKKAEKSGQDIKTFVEKIVEISVEPEIRSLESADFEGDMLAFSEGTENVPIRVGDYSRRELYADHD